MAVHETLLSGIAGYWPLGESSGNRVDSTGNNTLLENGAVSAGVFNPVFSAALQPNGTIVQADTANFLRLTDNTKLRMGNTNYTICCWYKRTEEVNGTLVAKASAAVNQLEYELGIDTTLGLYFKVYPYGGADFRSIVTTIPSGLGMELNKWNFVVCKKSINGPVEIKLNNDTWIDSFETVDGGGAAGGFASSTSRFSVGVFCSNTNVAGGAFKGQICGVGVWTRLLTDAECGDLWNGGYGLIYDFSYPTP